MQQLKLGIESRLIFVVVCLGFICVGAFMIYNERRLGRELEQLDASGVEAVATVTSHELERTSSGSSSSMQYVTQFTFTPASGDPQTGETSTLKGTELWFHVPPPGERILAEDLAVGDRILVTYLPGDPGIHRTNNDCPGCLDLGSFGDNIGIYLGGFLMLLGAAILFRIRRQLMAPL